MFDALVGVLLCAKTCSCNDYVYYICAKCPCGKTIAEEENSGFLVLAFSAIFVIVASFYIYFYCILKLCLVY